MTHRLRGSFGEHPEALCGVPEPETVVDSDEAVTCWRCRAKIVIGLDESPSLTRGSEWIRLECAWAAIGPDRMTDAELAMHIVVVVVALTVGVACLLAMLMAGLEGLDQ